MRSRQVVEEAWRLRQSGSPAYALCQRLKATKVALRRWNKKVFGHIQSKIQRLQAELDEAQKYMGSTYYSEREKELSIQLLKKQQDEELLWKQKSRITWMRTPDLNTRFFFLSTITRRCRNNIDALRNADGVWLHERD